MRNKIRSLVVYDSFKYGFLFFINMVRVSDIKTNHLIIFGESMERLFRQSFNSIRTFNLSQLMDDLNVIKVGKSWDIPFGKLEFGINVTSPSDVGASLLSILDSLKNEYIHMFGAHHLIEIFEDDGMNLLVQAFDYITDSTLSVYFPLALHSILDKYPFFEEHFDVKIEIRRRTEMQVSINVNSAILSDLPDEMNFTFKLSNDLKFIGV